MKIKSLITVALILMASRLAMAEPTALELVKAGNEFIGVQSKDKVVEIRSEKSVGTLVPNVWHVVYYDPDVTMKAVEIKFAGGKKVDVSHPPRLLEQVNDEHKIFPPEELKIDSNRALEIAKSQTGLEGLKLTASEMRLEHGDLGAQWQVKFWAAKIKDPSENADVGAVILSAKDGAILKLDLHPKSVN